MLSRADYCALAARCAPRAVRFAPPRPWGSLLSARRARRVPCVLVLSRAAFCALAARRAPRAERWVSATLGLAAPASPMLWERLVAGICVGAAAPLRLPLGGDRGQLRGCLGGALSPPQLAHTPDPPHPVALLTPFVACYALSGPTTSVAELAAGHSPTARVRGVAATAVSILAAVAAACCGPHHARRLPHAPGPECNRHAC